MKPLESMTFQELKEIGVIHYYKERNYRIRKMYKEGRESGVKYTEMIKRCSESFFLGTDRIATLVCSRRQRKPKTTPSKCLECGKQVETIKKRFCESCAKARVRASQRRHKEKSLKKDKQTNYIIQ